MGSRGLRGVEVAGIWMTVHEPFGVVGVKVGEVTTGERSCGESVIGDPEAGEMVVVAWGGPSSFPFVDCFALPVP